MKLFLAGDVPWRELIYSKAIINCPAAEENQEGNSMNIMLAGGGSRADELGEQRKKYKPYILESFLQTTEKSVKYLPYYGDYMLDSGAFSMLMGNAKKVDLKTYVDSYIAYIQKYNVQKFFELDIDPIVGYEEVLKIRKYIAEKVGRSPIPVWHKSRGMKDFIEMCKRYKYVAIGGYVSGEFAKGEVEKFPLLIKEAHSHGAKIHGLGFTQLKYLPRFHFDSVDSTAWVSGNRFGAVYKFNGKTMVKYNKPTGMRVKNKEVAINNFVEWVKFQEYAKTHF
jgi:hypothetical protein